MKKINVVLTMEVKEESTKEEIYQEFRNKDIKNAYESNDLTSFVFVDCDTGLEIEEIDKVSKCDHRTVLAIYEDKEHTKISHYRCAMCGLKREEKFGKTIKL